MMNSSNEFTISTFIATSVDGYIAKKDDNLQWLEMVVLENEDYGFQNYLKQIDTVIMGRHTFEKIGDSSVWPYEGKRLIVLTTKETRMPFKARRVVESRYR